MSHHRPSLLQSSSTLADLFPEEKEDWRGYVEWEKYPERKALARELLKTHKFTPSPEFQFVPLPKTNPVLIGYRWKEYHAALGLSSIVDFSWATVQREKPDLIHLLDFPYNGETRRPQLLEGKITDNKYHLCVHTLCRRLGWRSSKLMCSCHLYSVRNHGGVPDIDEDALELEIGGLVNNPTTITLRDLKNPNKFPQAEVTVTLQCSGTRRIEQIQQYPGDGDELINAPWGEGAIGTAVYRGVPLKKVLKIACGGVTPDCEHLEFIGADTYFKKGDVFNYAVSVPWRKVRQSEEVLLAWEMNGEPLPKIHGYPLRAVVAGYIGARSCKWLYRINALREPSMGPVQSKEYLYYSFQTGKQNALYSNGFSIQAMPVSSAILTPMDKQVIVHDGKIELQGWSYSGNGNWVVRVEVSPDGGHAWYEVDQEDMTEKHYHAWRLWKTKLPVDTEGWVELCVRAWDSSNNTQPTFVRSAWNWDLHVTSSCHRIKIYSVNMSRPATRARLAQIEAHGGNGFQSLSEPLHFSLEDDKEYLERMRKNPREPKC
ncbi:sulfite oxidase mitochondrial precursor [Amylostereum chailletii]|nr:sulfite oxidase mitochondrial precursor [Amylostereum chailletii]